ncbi:MAG: hypothetical protein L0Z73_05875 [Gammaproteobacteria bacterium]|nr:hypothetical protein [Gammaproteobacteria bacterium]
MDIGIEKFSEKELVELNNKIVARLRFLNQIRNHSLMLEFNIGERVSFQSEGRPEIFGIITKYNKKTVSIITENGEHWNVSPMYLKKIKSREQSGNKNKTGEVIEFKPA